MHPHGSVGTARLPLQEWRRSILRVPSSRLAACSSDPVTSLLRLPRQRIFSCPLKASVFLLDQPGGGGLWWSNVRWEVTCWFCSISAAFGEFPPFLPIAQRGWFLSVCSSWWKWRLPGRLLHQGPGLAAPHPPREEVPLSKSILGWVKSALASSTLNCTSCVLGL